MIPKSITIGPLELHLYGVIIALAIFSGWQLAKKRAQLYKVPKALLDDPIFLLPLALAIVGARLYHVIDQGSYYFENPAQILAINNGGLGIFGGLVGAFTGLYIVAKIKRLNFLSLLDLASPSILLGQVIGRIGNFINQEGFGPPTDLPWGVFIGSENRPSEYILFSHFHPTFFYEAFLNAIFFLVLLVLSKNYKKPGQAFALYLILYSAARFITEFWRIDTWQTGNIKIAHVITVTMFAIGIGLLLRAKKEYNLKIKARDE